jgi:glycosyltransferase involved in cell wall biosynthesis
MHRLKPNFKAPDIFALTQQEVPRYTLVVQGRFHAFALAKSLLALDMPVQVITNYPAFLAERFGLPRNCVTGCAPLGLLHRYAYRWNIGQRSEAVNRFLHVAFSHWAAGKILKSPPDVLHCFSGVALEIYKALKASDLNPLTLLARGSAHIREQHRDLAREAKRAQCPDIDLPTPWMVRREMEEYRLSDHIVTLSSYARNSFLSRGYTQEKVLLLELGSNVSQFRPERAVIDRRLERLRSGKKMVVLYTGNVSLQKGIIDLIEAARMLKDKVHFRVVGNVVPDAASRVAAARDCIEFLPRVPEQELPGIYNEADAYVFPTLHDGFAAVLAQARAGCLPIVATDHCAAPDMLTNGETGWVIPTRNAQEMAARLTLLNEDRQLAAGMVENLWQRCDTRDWSDVGKDFLHLAASALQARASAASDRPRGSV